jgi:hypothetical protein
MIDVAVGAAVGFLFSQFPLTQHPSRQAKTNRPDSAAKDEE